VTAVEERTRGPLLVTRTARVVTLTLHDPPVNPIARETVAALEELTAAIAADDSVRAVVVTGSGGNFSAGANIKQFGDIGTVETEEGYTRRRVAMVSALERLGKPVVAAVAGNCLGGGFEIALACHFRLADTTARFGLPEITLGVLPAWGGTQRLSRLVPRDVALRMLLLGEPVPAERARELGIVSEVHAPGGAGRTGRRAGPAPGRPVPAGHRRHPRRRHRGPRPAPRRRHRHRIGRGAGLSGLRRRPGGRPGLPREAPTPLRLDRLARRPGCRAGAPGGRVRTMRPSRRGETP
jgi:enoyl-CoA hydratase